MKRGILLLIFAFLFCYPHVSSAQSKPKRDVSKDRNVTVQSKSKGKSKTTVRIAEKKKVPLISKKVNEKVAQTPVHATYLKVNQLSSITKTLSSNEGIETFNISTDGQKWFVDGLPSWCHVRCDSVSFVLSYESNNSFEVREDWFVVKCDDQEVVIEIKQDRAPLIISSTINSASLHHNTKKKDTDKKKSKTNYLRINANVTIKGAEGQKCLIEARVTDNFFMTIKADPSYGLNPLNDVYATTEVIPKSNDAETFDVILELPNNAMILSNSNHKLRCNLAVYCPKTSSYISDTNYSLLFNAKANNNKVTTKKQ